MNRFLKILFLLFLVFSGSYSFGNNLNENALYLSSKNIQKYISECRQDLKKPLTEKIHLNRTLLNSDVKLYKLIKGEKGVKLAELSENELNVIKTSTSLAPYKNIREIYFKWQGQLRTLGYDANFGEEILKKLSVEELKFFESNPSLLDGYFKGLNSAGSKSIKNVESSVNALKEIFSTEELVKFLNTVNETTTIAQLEEKGIKVFFRGTTRDINGNLFPGNPNSIANGISTSTDPVRATIFAIESATQSGSKGVLQIAIPNDLKSLKLLAPNRRVPIELEVVFSTSADNFAIFSKIEIPVNDARQLVKEIYGIELPSRLRRDEATNLLETLRVSTLEQSFDFFQKIIK